jgi:hypothetical protein
LVFPIKKNKEKKKKKAKQKIYPCLEPPGENIKQET